MKKMILFIMLIFSSIIFSEGLHTMQTKVGDVCTLNRGELSFEDNLCDNKDRIEFISEDGEKVTVEVKNSYFDKIRRNLLLDFVNFSYLLYDKEE